VKKLLVAAVGALTLATVLVPPAAVADERPVAAGDSWLVRQLTDGVVHNDQYDVDDVGLTIDTALALAAIDAPAGQLAEIRDGLAGAVDGYVQFDEGTQTGYYAGSAAKALVAAQVLGADPSAFGGVDLVDATEDRVLAAPPVTGRIADDSSYGDYANTIGQSFAARGLSDAGSADAEAVVDFLLQQQCTDGGFRQDLTADKAALEQGCAGTDTSDVDATALSVLNLMEIDAPTPDVTTAITAATTWLAGLQATDGSFSGTGTGAANSNSTGLAGWALGAHGDDAAAAKAAIWVRRLQTVTVGRCRNELSGEQGAIALDRAALLEGASSGITVQARDQWRRTTTQALPVLRWAPGPSGARTVTGGTTAFVRAGTQRTVTATGMAPGDEVCGWTRTTQAARLVGADGTASIPVRMPGSSGSHDVTVTDSAGRVGMLTFKVLAKATLPVALRAKQIRQRQTQRVTVSGLQPGEWTKVYVRGDLVGSGRAGDTGRFAVEFVLWPARYPTGAAAVRAVGGFGNRVGTNSFQVLPK
jgi:hypothetical protein